ncbi:hypothetical protein Skr01_53260 [Sphaerisporangium krabiense]|nr:hypothetical protein Skr01_53260 [Sphaerisporangium krabiense]
MAVGEQAQQPQAPLQGLRRFRIALVIAHLPIMRGGALPVGEEAARLPFGVREDRAGEERVNCSAAA